MIVMVRRLSGIYVSIDDLSCREYLVSPNARIVCAAMAALSRKRLILKSDHIWDVNKFIWSVVEREMSQEYGICKAMLA
jgi:hypothetical protein